MAEVSQQPHYTEPGDADSIECIDDDFCIVEEDSENLTIDHSVVDSLTSSDFSLGSESRDAEEDTSVCTQEIGEETESVDDMDGKKSRKKRHNDKKKEGPHVNRAFEDDDGFVVVGKDQEEITGDIRSSNTKYTRTEDTKDIATANTKDNIRSVDIKDYGSVRPQDVKVTCNVVSGPKKDSQNIGENVQSMATNCGDSVEMKEFHDVDKSSKKKHKAKSDARDNKASTRHPQIKYLRESSLHDVEDDETTNKSSDVQNRSNGSELANQRPESSQRKLPDPTVSISTKTPQINVVVEANKPRHMNRPRRTGETDRSVRPQSNSISFLPIPDASPENRHKSDSGLLSLSRSQSMRASPTTEVHTKGKSRKLLRDLSFSDADSESIRNYGALSGGQAIPRRKPLRQADKENDVDPFESSHIKVTPELKTHIHNLMQELLDRGKVHQVAVLEQDSGATLESLPPWKLTRQDELGLVKSIMFTTQMMLKLQVGVELYSFFKHGQSRMVGRAGDNVMVVEKTNTCVVVGVADDDTPGSCVYEVSELAQALMDKGW